MSPWCCAAFPRQIPASGLWCTGREFGGLCAAGQCGVCSARSSTSASLHLATNMCVCGIWPAGRAVLGRGLVAVYVLNGNRGKFTQRCVHPQVSVPVCSGAVFDWLASSSAAEGKNWLPCRTQEFAGCAKRSTLPFKFCDWRHYDVLHTAIQIDNMAHLGGFLCGRLRSSAVPRIAQPGANTPFALAAYGSMLSCCWSSPSASPRSALKRCLAYRGRSELLTIANSSLRSLSFRFVA